MAVRLQMVALVAMVIRKERRDHGMDHPDLHPVVVVVVVIRKILLVVATTGKAVVAVEPELMLFQLTRQQLGQRKVQLFLSRLVMEELAQEMALQAQQVKLLLLGLNQRFSNYALVEAQEL